MKRGGRRGWNLRGRCLQPRWLLLLLLLLIDELLGRVLLRKLIRRAVEKG